MFNRLIRLLAAQLMGLLLAAHAHAEPARVQLAAYRVHTLVEDGQPKERLQTIDQLKPGELIEYHAVYNGGSAGAKNVLLTVPVPDGGLVYVDHGAQPAAAQGSLDGKTFAALPLTRLHTLPDGRQVRRAVPAAEIRFLRWDLGDVAAGATRTVKARMQLPALITTTASVSAPAAQIALANAR